MGNDVLTSEIVPMDINDGILSLAFCGGQYCESTYQPANFCMQQIWQKKKQILVGKI